MFLLALCLLCAIHFHTIDTDVFLCTLFIPQSCKDDRKFTHNCCPVAKHEGSSVLDQNEHDIDASVNDQIFSYLVRRIA